MPGPDPEAAYYQAVEEYFVSRRGDPLFLSNADWNLVRKWRLAGLPLRVVLRGIREALDAHAYGWSRDRKVGSLAYCAHEVDAARERWEKALVLGRDEGAGGAAAALEAFACDLERASVPPSARPVADAIARELRERRGGDGLETLDGLARPARGARCSRRSPRPRAPSAAPPSTPRWTRRSRRGAGGCPGPCSSSCGASRSRGAGWSRTACRG